MTFNIPIYDFITQLCRLHAKVIQNSTNVTVHNIEQVEVMHRKYKRLEHDQAYDCSSDLAVVIKYGWTDMA